MMIDNEQQIKDAAKGSLITILDYIGYEFDHRTNKGNCPFHNEKNGSLSINARQGYWNCFGCGEGGDAAKFVMKYNNVDYPTALKTIADALNIAVEYAEQTPEQIERQERNKRTKSILNDIQIYQVEGLQKDKQHLDYAISRMGTAENVKKAGMGVLTDKDALKRYLLAKGHSVQDIEQLGLWNVQRIGHTNTLAIPVYRGQELITHLYRPIIDGVEPKYLKYDHGHNEYFGMMPFGYSSLVIVEGIMDAHRAKVEGIENIACINGANVTVGQIRDAINNRYTTFTLMNDTDATNTDPTKNTKRTYSNIQTFIKVFREYPNTQCKLYIANIKQEDKDKKIDPADYINKYGISKFKDIIANAEIHWEWMAGQALEDNPPTTTRDAIYFWEKIGQTVDTCTAPQTYELTDYLNTRLTTNDATPIGRETIKAHIAEYRERNKERFAKERLADALCQATTYLHDGKLSDAFKILQIAQDGERDGELMAAVNLCKPYSAEEAIDEVTNRPTPLPTGLKLTQYTNNRPTGQTYKLTIAPAQLTIVAACTGHGKTSIMVQMLINMAKANPAKRYYYFAYEDERAAIHTKLSTICPNWYELIEGGRIVVVRVDKATFTDTTLTNAIRILAKQANIGAIFVDYIQCMAHDQRMGKTYARTEELGYIAEMLDNTAIDTAIPIILGSQLNRSAKNQQVSAIDCSYLSESTHIEQKANGVILVWNCRDTKGNQEGYIGVPDGASDKLFVKWMKRRNGDSTESGLLQFDQPTGRITTIKTDNSDLL